MHISIIIHSFIHSKQYWIKSSCMFRRSRTASTSSSSLLIFQCNSLADHHPSGLLADLVFGMEWSRDSHQWLASSCTVVSATRFSDWKSHVMHIPIGAAWSDLTIQGHNICPLPLPSVFSYVALSLSSPHLWLSANQWFSEASSFVPHLSFQDLIYSMTLPPIRRAHLAK